MPRTKRVVRVACQILSEFYKEAFQYKTCLLLKYTIGNFVEGLVIENTSYKSTFYVWSIICPTWHLGSEPKLDYGNRLLNGSYFVGDANEVSGKIIEAVSIDDIAWRRCCGPPTQVAEFFSMVESSAVSVTKLDVEAHNNLSHVFDKAVLLLLYGDVPGGYTALKAYNRRGNGRGKYASVATDLIVALKVGDESWLSVIRDAQRKGRETMGLFGGDVR